MSDYLKNFMDECRRAEEHLRSVFGKDIPDEMIIQLIPKAVRILREDAIERAALSKLNTPKNEL